MSDEVIRSLITLLRSTAVTLGDFGMDTLSNTVLNAIEAEAEWNPDLVPDPDPTPRSEGDGYTVVAADQDEHSRTEFRRYPDKWEAVYLRERVGGGWYVNDSIVVLTKGIGK